MSRIQQVFAQLASQERTALIPFITAGDPTPDFTVGMMHGLVEAGADIIELGVPFSDPMADGPTIQKASERALEKGVRTADVLKMVAEFRQTNSQTPVVLMGYLNPIEAMTYEGFAKAAQAVGVDGVLTVDMPPEEAREYAQVMKSHGLDPVVLIAPTSTPERIKKICDLAEGFVYSVSLKGVTGSKALDMGLVAEKLNEIRAFAKTPVGVGFGIRTPESAAEISKVADAVVVGSVLVEKIANNLDNPQKAQAEIKDILSSMRRAMDQK
jgi:tryptophan synthase alpha chain